MTPTPSLPSLVQPPPPPQPPPPSPPATARTAPSLPSLAHGTLRRRTRRLLPWVLCCRSAPPASAPNADPAGLHATWRDPPKRDDPAAAPLSPSDCTHGALRLAQSVAIAAAAATRRQPCSRQRPPPSPASSRG
ncbi:unnamed protein product [Urochloa humidicola]